MEAEGRGDRAERRSGARALAILVERHGEGRETRQIGVGIRRILDGVLGIEEIRNALIGAVLLADDEGRVADAVIAVGEALAALDDIVAKIGDAVIMKLARLRQAGTIYRLQLRLDRKSTRLNS